MKNNIYIIGIIIFIILNGCQDLDRDVITTLDKETATELYSYTQRRATAQYIGLQSGFFEIGDAMIASACDEAEFTYDRSTIQQFNVGSWSAIQNPNDVWATYYIAIRNVNLYLEESDNVNLDMYRLDPTASAQIIYKNRKAEIERWKYEGRFLRAYYYFELIKRYGGVPLITNATTYGDDYSDIERSTLNDCVQFITSECDVVAAVLPAIYSNDEDFGRATKGAALALKAKVLLFAASDLWNDPSWASGYAKPLLISLPEGNRAERWEAAADAAKAVIDLEEAGYDLANNYRNLFLTNQSFQNPEHILVRRQAASSSFEVTNYSIGFDNGESGNTPSQNLVDAYEIKVNASTAVAFDWNNPNHASNPFATSGSTARDPRLFANVVVNNSTFKGRTMEIWTGGKDGKGLELASKTGYYLKKFVDEDIDLLTGTTSIHCWPLIRLSDVYLWYAEALNEYNPGNTNINFYINQIRGRTTVNMPPVQVGLSQDEMREVIRHERFVELAFEGHRIWDVRRWMTAQSVLGVPLKGLDITKSEDGVFNYSVFDVEDRQFEPKMYFYPIPQQELLKMPKWIQNPLW